MIPEQPPQLAKRNPRDRQRRSRFARGAAAIARLWPELDQCYICPLCEPPRGFRAAALDTGELTLDHVPPDKLGGRLLVLICRDCNSRAGSELDHHMLTQEQILHFARGTMEIPLAGVGLELADRHLTTRLLAQGDTVRLQGPPSRHQPPGLRSAIDAELAQLSRGAAPKHYEMRLNFPPHDSVAAAIGWLRAAYLIAFAAFGYRYAFRSDLRPVREQLARRASRLLPRFSFTDPDQRPDERRLVLIEQPPRQRGLVVQMGRHTVLLPGLDHDPTFFDRLAAEPASSDRVRISFTGKSVPWPTEPVLALDFL